MNSPSQNRGLLQYYRSQVTTPNTNKSPTSKAQNKNNFKLSLVPDLTKKYQQYQQKQPKHLINRKSDQLFSQRNFVKGYEHLLSPKTKQNVKSPLKTYRSRQNPSPQTLRQKFYFNERQIELEQNRSVKFISKLRQQINSSQNNHECSRSTKKHKKQLFSPIQRIEKKCYQPFVESTVHRATRYQTKIVNNHENIESSQMMQSEQSPERQIFQKKLMHKCKVMELQLQKNHEQILKLKNKFQILQLRHLQEVNSLKSHHMLQKSKLETQLKIVANHLQQLQKSIKNLQRSKNTKQKSLQQEISKYMKQLKQSQQQKNKMILQFQSILNKQRLQAQHKNCSDHLKNNSSKTIDENIFLKQQVINLEKKWEKSQQEKEDIFQESKLLNLQLTNYTKWNDQSSHKIRILERKLQESELIYQRFQSQNHSFQQRIDQLQKNLKVKQNRIKQMQKAQLRFSEQAQIFLFETQSLRNGIQSKQRQFQKQKYLYLQQISILETKYLCCNSQKIKICQDLAQANKQLANSRRMIESLEENQEEKQRQIEEVNSLKDMYLSEYKQKSESLAKKKQQIIFKDNELQRQAKRIQQLTQEINIIRIQKSYNSYDNQYINQIQEEKSEKVFEDLENNDNVSECLERIEILQTQLNELIGKFKHQKLINSKKHEKQKQQLKKRIEVIENQLFCKEESYIDAKKLHSQQVVHFQQLINNLEQQIRFKNKQINGFNNELKIKQIKIENLINNTEELQRNYYERLNANKIQLNEFKSKTTQQIMKERQIMLEILYGNFQRIDKCIDEAPKFDNGKQKNDLFIVTSSEQNQLTKNQLQICEILQIFQQEHQQTTSKSPNKCFSNQKKTQGLSQFKLCPSIIKNLQLINLNDHQLQMQFISRTQQITSFINLLKNTIESLKLSIHSQITNVQQQYIHKICQLENKIGQQHNLITLIKIVEKDQRQGRQKLQNDIKRLREQFIEKSKQIEQLKVELQFERKKKQQMEQLVQTKEKQNRKTIKKLTIDIEQIRSLYILLKEQKSNHFIQEVQRNSNFSNTTVNREDFPQKMSKINLNKMPIKFCNLHENCAQQQITHNSLQEILQLRINQLIFHNDHLSNQLKLTKNELTNSKQISIELKYVIQEFQKQIQNVNCQNDKLKQQIRHLEVKEKLIQQQFVLLQRQNYQNQTLVENQILTLKQNELQLLTIKQKLLEIQSIKNQLRSQLQAVNKQKAQNYVEAKRLNEQTIMEEKQIQTLKIQKARQILKFTKIISEYQCKLKGELQKRKQIQKVHLQLLTCIQTQQIFPIKKYLAPTQLLIVSQIPTKNFIPNEDQFQRQTIRSITQSFSNKIRTLNHTIQEIHSINQILKSQIQHQKQLTQVKQLEINKKQTQTEAMKEKVDFLEQKIQKLEIEAEEWKFICQSNDLNKSIGSQFHKSNVQLSPKTKFTICQQKKKNPTNSNKLQLKRPLQIHSFQKQHLSSRRNQINSYSNKNIIVSMIPNISQAGVQINLINSLQSSETFGQPQQFWKGKNAFNSSGEISFF